MAWDYQAEVAADTPYLWYRMNETSGTVAVDSGSNAEDGTYAGNALERVINQPPIIWGGGLVAQGRSVDFNLDAGNANDGRLERAALTLASTTEIGIEFWLIDPVNSGGWPCGYAVTGTMREFAVEYVQVNQLRLYINGVSTTFNLLIGNNNLSDGRIHHIYIDWRSSDGRARLFVDGCLHVQNSGFQTGSPLTSGGTLMLSQDQSAVGVIVGGAQAYDGRLDQFALYSAALSEDRIGVHASAGVIRYATWVEHDIQVDPLDFIPLGGDVAGPYPQRIFDSGVGDWVYYTLSAITATPGALDTIPNHTNSLVASTHEVL